MDEHTTARIRGLRRLHLVEVQQSIARSVISDPDVEIEQQTLSLRCPLSQVRIRDPCRFSGCDHYQCFDATSFLLFTHATRTRSSAINLRCPVCNRDASVETLVIDLFFDDILKRMPAAVDEVDLQPNGEWRTRDGQISSSRDATRPADSQSMLEVSNASRNEKSTEQGREVIYIDSRSSLSETSVGPALGNENNDARISEEYSSDPESTMRGIHFWSIATAVYKFLPPLPLPFSLPQAPSLRENRPEYAPPLVPEKAFKFLAARPSRRDTRSASSQLPPVYQLPAPTPGMTMPPPLVYGPGMAHRFWTLQLFGNIYIIQFLGCIGFGLSLWILMHLINMIEVRNQTIQLSMLFAEHQALIAPILVIAFAWSALRLGRL
ncbi:hypothetical protein B0J17DRAFT_676838 [Rhizoctonia solani]|nr:hypothetical protein B0J17DRAFT_676838 [Rhizoctonia solani]